MSASHPPPFPLFFFFNDTATTEIYTLSLHDALPISRRAPCVRHCARRGPRMHCAPPGTAQRSRSEEHTSELQSQSNLVCRLLLEKKKKISPVSYSSIGATPKENTCGTHTARICDSVR